jgi:hypothetical protein
MINIVGMQTEVIHTVDWYKLAAAIETATGIRYQLDAVSNDTDYKCTVVGKLDDFDTEEYVELKRKQRVEDYHFNLLLDGLCDEGLLDPGVYLIQVSW